MTPSEYTAPNHRPEGLPTMPTPNIYLHPVGTPVRYVCTITDTPEWLAESGTVTDTWLTQDEPGEQPYRVYQVALVGGGTAVWAHECAQYDFAWRDRTELPEAVPAS